MPSFPKDPDATLDYVVDWSDWLDGTDWISGVSTSAQSGITLSTQSFTSTQHTIWLAGGAVGQQYSITSHITTNAGRVDERSFTVRVRER